ncbi:MAG: hypothetical protein KAY35_03375, partial [Faecalibacterium sp.]|nr:hypothetical protein [Faecalibacterium sp.]
AGCCALPADLQAAVSHPARPQVIFAFLFSFFLSSFLLNQTATPRLGLPNCSGPGRGAVL